MFLHGLRLYYTRIRKTGEVLSPSTLRIKRLANSFLVGRQLEISGVSDLGLRYTPYRIESLNGFAVAVQ